MSWPQLSDFQRPFQLHRFDVFCGGKLPITEILKPVDARNFEQKIKRKEKYIKANMFKFSYLLCLKIHLAATLGFQMMESDFERL